VGGADPGHRVTVAGAAQPPLWGGTGLIRAVSRLLDIKP